MNEVMQEPTDTDADCWSTFFSAACNGNVGVIQHEVEEGICVNHVDPQGKTALHHAVCNNQLEVCKLLIMNGADVNISDTSNGQTPIFLAAHKAVDSTILELLLSNGACVNKISSLNKTLLHEFIQMYDENKLQMLLQAGVEDSINIKDIVGNTPIFYALIYLHRRYLNSHINGKAPCFTVTEELLKRGADVSLVNNLGYTLLHRAAFAGCADVIKHLLNIGCDITLKNKKGNTPFHQLLEFYGWHTSADCRGYETADDMVDVDALEECLYMFLDHGLDVDIRDGSGDTALHIVCKTYWYSHVVKRTLLDMGVNVNAKNIQGQTALHIICSQKDMMDEDFRDDLALFIQEGAEINVKDVNGQTPLFSAVECDKTTLITVEILLDMGADANVSNICGITALHMAAFRNASLVEMLLDHGANGMARDMHGDTPISYAFNAKFQEVVDVFIKRGIITHTKVMAMTKHITQSTSVAYYDHADTENQDVDLLRAYTEKYIEHFMHKPLVFDRDECHLMMEQIVALMQRLCEGVQRRDPRLSYTPVLSGSVSEGTKHTDPDEFDFLLCFDQFYPNIDVLEGGINPASYCKVILKQDSLTHPIADFFDDDDHCLTFSKFVPHLYTVISQVLSNTDMWKGLGFLWKNGPDCTSHKISTLNLLWVGPSYKCLDVAIDLVAALTMPGWWPQNIIPNRKLLTQSLKDEGCLIVMKPPQTKKNQVNIIDPNKHMRISFSKVETAIFNNQTLIVRKGYMLAKSIRNACPELSMGAYNGLGSADATFSTYALKTCLFEELEENGELIEDSEVNQHTVVRDIAYRIWVRLEYAVKVGQMTSYFVYEYKVYDEPNLSRENNGHKLAELYASTITSILKRN